MKKTILLAVLAVCSLAAFSQDDEDRTFKFGVGGTLSIPIGDLKEDFTYGVGFEGTGVYKFTENVGVFAQAGLGVFKSSDAFAGDANNVLHLLVMAGPRISFSGFFIGGGVGFGRWNNSFAASSGLLYSPQVGYDFGSYHAMLHYTGNKLGEFNYSYVGLKFFRTF